MADPKKEHPLANILINVIIPVIVLSYLSKDPALQAQLGKVARPWHLGPLKAIILALVLPLGYGIWFFVKTKKGNFFSALGLISVLLTGGLTLYLWNQDGTVKPGAGMLFGLKEGSIPFIMAITILFSQRTANPLLRVFLYNDTIFDIPKIESRVDEREARPAYGALLKKANFLFACSFFLSTAINVAVALYIFRGFDHHAPDALETYNQLTGKIMGWSFVVVLVPAMAFLFYTLQNLIKGLKGLTGLTDEEVMMPR